MAKKPKKNFYAVKKGFDIKKGEPIINQIYRTWAETEKFVVGINKKDHGVAVEYAGFVTEDEAIEYLADITPKKEGDFIYKKDNDYPNRDILLCTMDGSYSGTLENYSYGLVITYNDDIVHYSMGVGNNEEMRAQRQIGGELLGAMKAIAYAINNGHKKIVIFFDYIGVANHATGFWKLDTNNSKVYHNWVQEKCSKYGLEIIFCKVDAHTGDDFNEIADGLAKLALGIKPNPISIKMGIKYNIPELIAAEEME
ncbi:ribonuclease HI [Lysinibacillus sphaericus]|uniref:ribonuclease HI n=1 Tax=Lysinibacillus sphaericus TaxID=1421 RepID=UPI0018CE0A3B|nr:ribonuclease HI [Lysinibacillus sphaericus]